MVLYTRLSIQVIGIMEIEKTHSPWALNTHGLEKLQPDLTPYLCPIADSKERNYMRGTEQFAKRTGKQN